ncbi:MAG: hypothetical protein EOO73_06775 [Myxococcales bacterium]|nr:MAG: hypothetical protein EOO73_06775 [Myxococcales bacterium]
MSVLVLSLASPSHAQLLVVTSPGDSPALAHAELALALGEGQPVTWLSLRIRRGPVAVVAALPDAASCEPALDAWFAALERTASPNVLLPLGARDCGNGSSFVHVTWPRSPGVGAEELSLTTAQDVIAVLEEHGLGEGVLVPEAPRYAVWAWSAGDGEETTRTLRLSGTSAPLSFVPVFGGPVLVSVLSPEPRRLPGETTTEQLHVTFMAGEPRTDYLTQLERWLKRDRAPLLEARSTGALLGWSIVADAVSLPPLVRSYARLAADEGQNVDAESCAAQLQDFPEPTPDCGSATDAALALAAAGSRPVLQRWVTTGSESFDGDSLSEGGDLRPAALRARTVDESGCPAIIATPPIILPPGANGSDPWAGRGGGETAAPTEEAVVVQSPCSSDGCSSCGPGHESAYDDRHTTFYCSGDTSSSGGDDSCSSDSSSSSQDDSCSSDSSSSSQDDSCSSDSSSSSQDDSCSGSSGSSYDGDTCTGSAAPRAGSESAQAGLVGARGGRPQRLRLSLWSLAIAAVLLPIRRRKRSA